MGGLYSQRVTAGADDTVDAVTAGWSNSDVVLEVGNVGGNTYNTSVRFLGVGIPQGATVTSALLTFTAGANGNGAPVVKVYGDDSDNAVAPTDHTSFAGKSLTTAYTDWTQSTWVTDSTYTVNVLGSVQEIVNRAGWLSGNAMQFMILNNGSSSGDFNEAYSYDGSSTKAPKLDATWSIIGTTTAHSLLGTSHTDVTAATPVGNPGATIMSKGTTGAETWTMVPAGINKQMFRQGATYGGWTTWKMDDPGASTTILKSDGTDWKASTWTMASPCTSGYVLTSDGTNWKCLASGTAPWCNATSYSNTYIEDKIASAITAGCTDILIPVGTYTLGGTRSTARYIGVSGTSVNIRGQGPGTVLKKAYDIVCSPGCTQLAGYQVFDISGSKVTISDLAIDGDSLAANSFDYDIKVESGASDVSISNVRITGSSHAGIGVLGATNVTIKDSYIDGSVQNNAAATGIYGVNAGNKNIKVINNTILNCDTNGIFLGLGKGFSIQGNYLSSNHKRSLVAGGQIALGTATGYPSIVSNNILYDCGNTVCSGIESNGVGWTISGNTIGGTTGHTKYGIILQSATPVSINEVVTGNTIYNSGVEGIAVSANVSDFTITGNRVSGSGGWGIYVDCGSSDNYLINSNNLVGNTLGAPTNGVYDGGSGLVKDISHNIPSGVNVPVCP